MGERWVCDYNVAGFWFNSEAGNVTFVISNGVIFFLLDHIIAILLVHFGLLFLVLVTAYFRVKLKSIKLQKDRAKQRVLMLVMFFW